MADYRKEEDWRRREMTGRDMNNNIGRGDNNRTNFGSRGSGYPDDLDAGYGASRAPNYADRSDMWNDNGRFDFGGRYDSRSGGGYGDDRGRYDDNRDRYGEDRNYRDRDYGDRSGSDRSYAGYRYTTDPERQSSPYRNRTGQGGYGGGERNWMDKAGDEVASWFGDDNASQRRDVDKRRDGHYGRGPKGYRRSDARIAEDVNDRLSDDWRVDASEISVDVKDAEVTLTGTVNSRDDKRRAEDLAHDVSGVTHVQNNLRVTSTSQSGFGGSTGSTGSSTTSVSSGATGSTTVGSTTTPFSTDRNRDE